jgi:hypothetical protein
MSARTRLNGGVFRSLRHILQFLAFSLRDYTETAPTKKACRPRDAQAFVFLVAKGGIEPPTQGFSVLCSTN